MDRNEKLLNEFISVSADIRETLGKINQIIDNLEGNFNPDALTQADINSLLKIRFDLDQCHSVIADHLNGCEF